MDQRKHPGRFAPTATGFEALLIYNLYVIVCFFISLQTLCECALNSPYIILKLGMMAVLSTLSGTIAIKQYLGNMTGYTIFFSIFVNSFFNHKVSRCFIFSSEIYIKRNVAFRLSLTFIMVLMIFFLPSGSTSIPPRLTDLVKLAQECCFHSNLAVAAHGVIVLSNIVISCPEKG